MKVIDYLVIHYRSKNGGPVRFVSGHRLKGFWDADRFPVAPSTIKEAMKAFAERCELPEENFKIVKMTVTAEDFNE